MSKNILFIMCDQLRWDYLSCYGHPTLETPNIDGLAKRGVRFETAYCQSPLCGPSRASFYTGRYVSSHGAQTNGDPYKIGEKLLGDYLTQAGMRMAVIGKSAVRPNHAALKRLGIAADSVTGQQRISGMIEEIFRDDGLHSDQLNSETYQYNQYLRDLGYDLDNGWDRNANSSVDEQGNVLSGWYMRHAKYPANIKEEHSETAYTTNRAIEFMQSAGDQAWCMHLSYNKPHWPYIAPAPYHNMYTVADIRSAVRSDTERQNDHPVYQAFMHEEDSQSFAREEVRETVIPVYMGLIKQLDDHLGQLFAFMDAQGLTDNTMIVFTSDHGDYLGDHWLGEKYLFHDPSVRIPLIIVDPSSKAYTTRGTVSQNFAEAIDLVPTFVEYAGGTIETERIEGHSLLPLLHGEAPDDWRTYTISEIDYSDHGARLMLDIPPYDCRAYMIRDERYKFVLHELYRPQLFDLQNDPNELVDLGEDEALAVMRQRLSDALFRWLRRRRNRTELPTEVLFDMTPEANRADGLFIGRW